MADKIGRPLKFESAEELQKKIEAYWESCYKVEEKKGQIIRTRIKPYTVGGLAAFLDCDRDTLLNYEDKEEFFGTIKRAKQIIEADVEEGSLTGAYNATASIFNLKNNFGWKDKQEIEADIGNKDNKPFEVKQTHDLSKLSIEEKKQMLDLVRKMKDEQST